MKMPIHFSAFIIISSLFALTLVSCDSCTNNSTPTTDPTTPEKPISSNGPESSPIVCPPINKDSYGANCTTAGNVRNCTINWDAVQGITAYELTIKELVNNSWHVIKIDTVQTNSHQLSGLSGSSQYKLAIKCLCPGGTEFVVIDDLAIK